MTVVCVSSGLCFFSSLQNARLHACACLSTPDRSHRPHYKSGDKNEKTQGKKPEMTGCVLYLKKKCVPLSE